MTRLTHRLPDLLEWIVGGLLLSFTSLTLLQVFCRYALYYPLVWTEELARYLMIWLTFLGASVAVKRQLHMSIYPTIFSHFSSRPCKCGRLVEILVHSIVAVIAAVLLWQGTSLCLASLRVVSTALPISMAAVYASVPVSAFVMLAYSTHFVLLALRKFIAIS